jgi:hypothetical protein
MIKTKKNTVESAEVQKVKENNSKELSLDTLDEVAGGAIGNVRYTKTTD